MTHMISQKSFEGNDALLELQRDIHNRGIKNVFLFRGKHSYEDCGAKTSLEEIFSTESVRYTDCFDFENNPKAQDVDKCLDLLIKSGAEAIIAVGGGSVIDIAKLVRYKYSYGDLFAKADCKERNLLPLFAIPTTAGTGAEATPFAVCYVNKVKHSVDNPDILPDMAFLYPPFTYGNSPILTAYTGFDALAQAIEAYWNVNATNQSDIFAKEAIELLWKNLQICVNYPSEESRESVLKGAYLAGEAIAITRTTAPHAFSYAFTSYCNYPHGKAVALTFPYFFDLNVNGLAKDKSLVSSEHITVYQSKINTLLSMLGIKRECAMGSISEYIKSLNFKFDNLNNVDIRHLLQMVNLDRLKNNPIVVGQIELDELYNYLNSISSGN